MLDSITLNFVKSSRYFRLITACFVGIDLTEGNYQGFGGACE